MMLVNIHITCFNNPWQVENCLKSVSYFTKHYDAHVYDDQSDKEIQQKIGLICAKYNAHHHVNKEKRGWLADPVSRLLVPQLQKMLWQASMHGSELVVKMDSDAMFVRSGIEEVLSRFSGDMGGTIESGKITCAPQRSLFGLPPQPNHHIQGGFYVLRTSMIEKILAHHTKTGVLSKMKSHEDVMTTSAVYGLGGTVVDIPEIQSQWKQHLWKPRNVKPIVVHPVKNETEFIFADRYMADLED